MLTLPGVTLSVAVAQALRPALRHLSIDLRAAIVARRVRLVAIHTTDGRAMPRSWAVPLHRGEVVLALAALASPFAGVAALIVRASDLPAPSLDAAARERLADALADALLAELDRSSNR
ncbi:MAG: hypothetical protein ABSE49_35585 [Polyangiaceae bacterium]|jgi:hypothetical protein